MQNPGTFRCRPPIHRIQYRPTSSRPTPLRAPPSDLTSPPICPQCRFRPLHHRVLHRGCPSQPVRRLRLQQLRRAHARGLARQQRNAFAHVPHGVDMEQPAPTASSTPRSSIRWRWLRAGISTPWVPSSPRRCAGAEPAFDLFVDAAHGQHLAVLVECAGHRNALAQGRPDRLDSSAYSSAHEAESPSTPLYSCSNTMGVERQRRRG